MVKGTTQSIINKIDDYVLLGLQVINSSQKVEHNDLLNNYKAWINI